MTPTGFPPNFPLAELVRSERARRMNLDNTPNAEHEANLRALA
jgi:hypothetical protein